MLEDYMAALIIRLPDGKRERLKDLARARKQSVTKLFDEMATVLLEAATQGNTYGRLIVIAEHTVGRGRVRVLLLQRCHVRVCLLARGVHARR